MAFFRKHFKPTASKQTSLHPLFEHKGIMEQILFEQLKSMPNKILDDNKENESGNKVNNNENNNENKSENKEHINEDKNIVGLFNADAAKLSMAGIVNFSQFKNAQTELESQFLKYVALGEQNSAEYMLQHFPDLLFSKAEVTDYSERTFKQISGFEYAIWALDSRMWTMFLRVIDALPEEHKNLAITKAKEQLESVEKNGVNYQLNKMIVKYVKYNAGYNERPEATMKMIYIKAERHYDFKLAPTLEKVADIIGKSRQFYAHHETHWKGNHMREVANKCWSLEVGGEQRLAPAHIMQEMCCPGRSFIEEKTFNRNDNFERNLILADSKHYGKLIRKPKVYYPLGNELEFNFNPFGKDKLGAHYAIICDLDGQSKIQSHIDEFEDKILLYNSLAMTRLRDVRIKDLEDLKKELEIKPVKRSIFSR